MLMLATEHILSFSVRPIQSKMYLVETMGTNVLPHIACLFVYRKQYLIGSELCVIYGISEYDQKLPQSRTADQPTAL